jgi:uncharacterized protein YggE
MRFMVMTIAALTLMVLPAYAQETCCENKATRLDISAQAEAKAVPDIAMISAGVLTISPKADVAMKDNATKMTAVFAALEKAGIKEKDVQTSGVSLNPQYNYIENKPPQIINYQANNNLTIKIRDMRSIGPVLDALIAQGINQMNGPSFSIDNPDTIMDMAREEAIKKALARAEIYAKAAGMKVKRIVMISENAGYGAPQPMMAMAARSMDAKMEMASTPVATGEVSMSVTVNISVELE